MALRSYFFDEYDARIVRTLQEELADLGYAAARFDIRMPFEDYDDDREMTASFAEIEFTFLSTDGVSITIGFGRTAPWRRLPQDELRARVRFTLEDIIQHNELVTRPSYSLETEA